MLQKGLKLFSAINILCHHLAEKTNSNYTFFIQNSTETKSFVTFSRGGSGRRGEELCKIARFKNFQISARDVWVFCSSWRASQRELVTFPKQREFHFHYPALTMLSRFWSLLQPQEGKKAGSQCHVSGIKASQLLPAPASVFIVWCPHRTIFLTGDAFG